MAEQIIHVDAHNNILGPRSYFECHKKKLWHRSTHILLFNPQGKVFVQQRNTTQLWPYYYDMSLSGHPSWGETSHAAAIRELYEELGIRRKRLQRIGTLRIVTPIVKVFMEVYVAKNIRGKMRLQKKEVRSGEFIAPKDVPALLRQKKCTPMSKLAWDMWKKN